MSARLSIICIWFCFITLLIIGIVMVASTGTKITADETVTQALFRQSEFALVGLVAALFISNIDYHKLRPWVPVFWFGCVVLLICCFLPGIGKEVHGEHRWLNLGAFTFQPSEVAKSILMITLAHWYTTHREVAGTFWKGFVAPGVLFGFPLLLILVEKDMGTAAALAVSGFCVMFVAGVRGWVLLLAILIGFLILYDQATASANRVERIFAWNNLEAHARGAGRQQWVAQLAMGSGGITGVGLGNSIYKSGSLPFAHTDFIFAILGEEWGFIGTACVLLLFTLMTLAGVVLALQIRDTFGRLLAVGLVSTIFWPAMLNMMVVTSLLPNTGLPLPFISYGGTNLVFTMVAIGLLTSIQRHTPIIRENYWPTRRLQDKNL
ncbi:MAG: cell division protein FtsW [Akkermansiaceae bacterium]|nr:cell division protein FtsW [Akkermansiaceae bacterium]